MLRGKCGECGTTKTQFTKADIGKGVVKQFINNLPFEAHLPGHNFTGPGTKLNRRLNEDLTPKPWGIPINRVDDSAYRHDTCYAQNKYTKTRNEVCDNTMLAELIDINNPRGRENVDKALVQKIIGTTVRFGWGLLNRSRWTDELAEELHKPVTRKFQKRRVIARGVDNIWAADLVDVKAFAKDNEGVE